MGPQDGEGVPRLLQPTQETGAAPGPKDLQAPESGDHVPKDDRDTGPHQPLPDRRALRHGAPAPAHQRARLQDRHALLPRSSSRFWDNKVSQRVDLGNKCYNLLWGMLQHPHLGTKFRLLSRKDCEGKSRRTMVVSKSLNSEAVEVTINA